MEAAADDGEAKGEKGKRVKINPPLAAFRGGFAIPNCVYVKLMLVSVVVTILALLTVKGWGLKNVALVMKP